MWSTRIVLALQGVSVLIVAELVVGSFVTFAPAVDGVDIQNYYIHRILQSCTGLAVLQAATVILLLLDRRKLDTPVQP